MSHIPVPDINKRHRDDATEALIREALEEEQQRKRAKKGELAGVPHAVQSARVKPKGQTLREIEEAEGGPVKESWVGMAAVQRALRRKKKQQDDDETGLPDDIAACEEYDEQDAEAAADSDDDGGGYGRRQQQRQQQGNDDDDDDDMDMFGDEGEDAEQQQQQQQKRVVGGRVVPKGISAAVAAAMEGDGGYAVTGFNMAQEREEGNIDEEGNFIPAQEDDETAKDAWLNSDEAKPISGAAAAAAAARQAALAAADDDNAPSLSETAIAQAQREVASLLLAGESVSEGLRRLAAAAAGKGKALGKREKQRQAQQQQQKQKQDPPTAAAGSSGSSMDSSTAATAFARLTELADLLLSAGGELGIYTDRKEALERFAAAVLPQTDLLAGKPAAGAGAAAAADDDMFADLEEDEDDKGANKQSPAAAATKGQQQQQGSASLEAKPGSMPAAAAAAAAQQAGEAVGSNGSTAAAAAAVDYSSWPVKELRRFLAERGVDSSSIVEKDDLVAQVKRIADSGPVRAAGAPVAAPAGYNYDRTTGYYHNTDTGLYWDSKSGAFYNSTEQKWYCWDEAAGEYKEWTQQQ